MISLRPLLISEGERESNYLKNEIEGWILTIEISVAIIGGGVVGCATASELSKTFEDVFLLEKNPGVTKGENQSSRNSGVIHSGVYYDHESRPEKACLCVEGNSLLYEFCRDHRVPAIRTGKLLVATSNHEEEILEKYLRMALTNSVPDVKLIPGSEVRKKEPGIRAKSALLLPSAGIIDPTALVYRLHTIASGSGVHTLTDTEVVGLEPDGDWIRLTVKYRDGFMEKIRSRAVINAAGVEADRIARLWNPDSPFELDPIKGETYKFYGHRRPDIMLQGMNVYPTPREVVTPHGKHFTVGVHLTPTFENSSYPPSIGSTVTIGPRLTPVKDRDAWSGRIFGPEMFVKEVRTFFPGLRVEDLLWHQDGLQSRLKGHPDFMIQSDPGHQNMINLLGIDSPGLTSCLAIGRRIYKMMMTQGF